MPKNRRSSYTQKLARAKRRRRQDRLDRIATIQAMHDATNATVSCIKQSDFEIMNNHFQRNYGPNSVEDNYSEHDMMMLNELKSANLSLPPDITITAVATAKMECNGGVDGGGAISMVVNNANMDQQFKQTLKCAPRERSKYSQLLAAIEEIGRDVRPSYTGSKTSTERLKRSIMHARVLVHECLTEVEMTALTT